MTNSPQFAASRREAILDLLARTGELRIAELAEALGVAAVTLRRDLQHLEEQGLLIRVHGGAVPAPGGAARRRTKIPSEITVGVLVPSLGFYWPQVVRSLEEAAREHGVSVVLRSTSYDLQDERPVLQRMREEDGVSGFVVAPNTDTEHSADVIAWLESSGLPYVLAEREAVVGAAEEPVEAVTTDHALGAAMAARHLVQLGHRRVGLLFRASPTARKIAAGWSSACRSLGLASSDHLERMLPDRGAPDFSSTVQEVLESIANAGVTGLLVHSDREAMAIVDLVLAQGLAVPGDLSVIAYDDEFAELFTPPITGIAPPRAMIGRLALELLLARIAEPDRPVQRALLNPALNVRASTAAPREG
ncbi:substrate-binding domain-containing protein [Microbacterium sp. JZ70]